MSAVGIQTYCRHLDRGPTSLSGAMGRMSFGSCCVTKSFSVKGDKERGLCLSPATMQEMEAEPSDELSVSYQSRTTRYLLTLQKSEASLMWRVDVPLPLSVSVYDDEGICVMMTGSLDFSTMSL